jgi:hypothetical protein
MSDAIELFRAETRPRGIAMHRVRPINADKLARNVFLLVLAYVLAVIAAIWLFIGGLTPLAR